MTNRTWEHFWLNEVPPPRPRRLCVAGWLTARRQGWTMFVQRRIMSLLSGEPAAQLDAIGGLKAMNDSIDHFGHDHSHTALIPDLTGVDPDDAFSSVPYEKGFNFLWHLCTAVGGLEVFKPFVLAYVKRFAHKTLTSADFKSFFIEFFGESRREAVAAIDWETWFHAPGPPPVQNTFDQTLNQDCAALAEKWARTRGDGVGTAEWEAFLPAQRIVFLNAALADTAADWAADKAVLAKMDALYSLSTAKNCELKMRWCELCLRAEEPAILPLVTEFVGSVGRMKYVRPLYRKLFASTMGKQVAVDTFTRYRDTYHPIAAKMIAKDLAM